MGIKVLVLKGLKQLLAQTAFPFPSFPPTVETSIKALMLKFYLLRPLNKNTKEAETGTGSCIMGFILCNIMIQE